jgi:uncharacterized protein
MKFLLWAVVAAIVVMWLTRGKKISSNQNAAAGNSATASDKSIEPMVQCAHCGIHLPVSEAITTPSGKVFCSDEHRLQYAKP